MAWFTKKEWKNRLAEFAGRRTLTDVATGASQVVDVARNEGTISQEGDAFSAANMNEFEQRILEGFTQAENATTELNQNMGNCTFSVQSDGAYVTYVPTGGADPVSKKLGSGSGTLTIKFTFKAEMNRNDGGNPSGNTGTVIVKITDGKITSQSITGSGKGTTIGGSATAGICTISDFSITLISWKPE